MSACKNCGKNSVVADAHFSNEQLVCTECGTVQSEGSFQDEPNQKFYSGINDSSLPLSIIRYGHRSKGLTKVRIAARDRLFDMASEFNFTSVMKGEALRLFTDACEHKTFRKLGEDKKITLAGCCIYAIVRQYGLAMTLSTISNYLGVDPCHLNSVYKSLKEDFSLTISAPNVEDIVSGFLKNLKFDHDTKQLVERMQKILRITKMSLISTGVSFQPLLTATCYIAWCSLQCDVKKKPYKNFCKHHSLVPSATSYKRLEELTQMLIELCKGLPWIQTKNINKKNIFSNVDSILKYPDSLLESRQDILEVCVANRKRRIGQIYVEEEQTESNSVVSNSIELTEDDLPTSEMSKYIRTAEEIKHLESLLD